MTESRAPSFTELQGRFNTLSKQRDDALNQTVLLSGGMAALTEQVEVLTQQRDGALKEAADAKTKALQLQEQINTLQLEAASLHLQLEAEKAVPRVTTVSS